MNRTKSNHKIPQIPELVAGEKLVAENSKPINSSMTGLGLLAQARLEVGRVNDPAELEADQTAAEFLKWARSGPSSADQNQLMVSNQTTSARRSSSGTMETGGFGVGGEVEQDIRREANGGQALQDSTRQQFEGFFGTDLGDVRVHADAKAAELSRTLGADAFTVGSNVFFGAGKFSPGNDSGDNLLAHELTHVVQQSRGANRRINPDAVRISRSPIGNGVIHRSISSEEAILTTSAGGLFVAFGGLLVAAEELFMSLKDEKSDSEKLLRSCQVLRNSSDITKSSLQIVVAAGGGMAGTLTQAIPGIGLIVSFMSLMENLLTQTLPLIHARKTANATLVELNKKAAGFRPGSPEDTNAKVNISAVKRVIQESSWKLGIVITKAVLDAVAIGGQIANLSVVGAPVGVVMTLAAVGSKVFVGAVDTVGNWVAEHKSAKAEVAYDAAKKKLEVAKESGDTGDIDTAQKAHDAAYQVLLSKSTRTAFKQLLEAAFQGMRNGEDFCEPSMRKLLLDYGVTEAFISDTEALFRSTAIEGRQTIQIDSEVALVEVGKLIAVGEPKTMQKRMSEWSASLGAGLSKAAGMVVGAGKGAGKAVATSIAAGAAVGSDIGKAVGTTVGAVGGMAVGAAVAGPIGAIAGGATGAGAGFATGAVVGGIVGGVVGPFAAAGRAAVEFFTSKPPPKFESDAKYEYVEKEVKTAIESALAPIRAKVKPGVGVTEKILNKALEKPYANLLARFIPKESVGRREQMNDMVTIEVKRLLAGLRSDGKEINVAETKITFTNTAIKITLALKPNMVAPPKKAEDTSKAPVETSFINPMHADKGTSDRGARVASMGTKK
jgi:hypothetical protein